MRYVEGITSSQRAATMVFACTLSVVLFLPADSNANPCDEMKSPQQSAPVKVKQEVSKSEFVKMKAAREPSKTDKVEAQTDKVTLKTVKSEKVANVLEKDEASSSEQVELEKSEAEPEQVVAIDMEILTSRLKKTSAIGLFTKLAIRNDVTDLMDNVKRYRKKSILVAKMKEIREAFEGLLFKIIALLEEDPELSRDMYVGRESIWKSLLEVKA